MRASGEHNIVLFNEFNTFSIKSTRVWYSIYHIYKNKNNKLLKWVIFQWGADSVTLTLARFNAIFLYSANDVTSKCYYNSVISFLLNGFSTLLRRGLYDKYTLFIKFEICMYLSNVTWLQYAYHKSQLSCTKLDHTQTVFLKKKRSVKVLSLERFI
jgi:hypothetical protein